MIMRKYETLLLISPELNEAERKAVLEIVQGVVLREKGELMLVDDWGVRDLAYPVRKHMRGHYIRLEYSAPGSIVAELERIIRITDGIDKFITVRLDENETALTTAEADA